ncbi:hypothetical protein [Paraburkholderia sp. BR10882]|uniref:hypothetical protein n=1 Tax=Paraburkholderia sp. BR10882 TaxID=3236991 RepID=UPI0034CF246E
MHQAVSNPSAPAACNGVSATTSFAVMQAVAAYGLSFVFSSSGGDYLALVAIGAAALVLVLFVDLFSALRAK